MQGNLMLKNYLAKKLLAHVGHDISIVTYGDGETIYDVCVECEDCGEVLVSAEDFEAEEDERY